MTTPIVFFHDQEPLNFDYYSKQDFYLGFKPKIYNFYNFDFKEVVQFKQRMPYITWNCYDYAILCHSEKNSKDLIRYEDFEFIGVYWWSHAAIARDWYRHAEHDLDLNVNFNKITHDFLIYNRAWSGTREYRLKFAEMILDFELISHCNMTFSPTDDNCNYRDHTFVNQYLKITRKDLEQFFPPNLASSSSSADYNSQDYLTAGVEVVLETLFDDGRLHLTEKSLRPIACGRPFMLAATAGSLEYLKSYGFETFDGLIDESYDLVQNPLQRLHAIAKEMQRISELSATAKLELWYKLYEIAKRNKKKFFSTLWHDNIFQEYQNNFDIAMKFMKKHRTGKRWRQVLDVSKTNPELQQHVYYPESGIRTPEDVEFVNAWLANPPN